MTGFSILGQLLTADMTNWFFAVFLAALTMILMALVVHMRHEVRALHRATRSLDSEATRLRRLRQKRRNA